MFAFQLKTNISRGLALFAFIGAFVFGSQPAALGAAPIPFRASYTLDIAADFSGFPLVGVTSHGAGLATHFGKLTTRSVSETVNLATGEGVALFQFIAANGDVALVSFQFLAVPTSATQFVVDGVWEIIGGTGRFDGATGAGSYHGVVGFTSPTTGLGNFNLTGSISSVGSAK